MTHFKDTISKIALLVDGELSLHDSLESLNEAIPENAEFKAHTINFEVISSIVDVKVGTIDGWKQPEGPAVLAAYRGDPAPVDGETGLQHPLPLTEALRNYP